MKTFVLVYDFRRIPISPAMIRARIRAKDPRHSQQIKQFAQKHPASIENSYNKED